MAFILRTFRSRNGRELELVESLKTLASGLVRSLQRGSVVICRQTNDPAQALWVGDTGSEADVERLASLTGREARELLAHSLSESSPALVLELLDEFYHFPPRPYQVWSLELRAPSEQRLQALKDLFNLTRVAWRENRIVGISLYQASEVPGLFVGFVGLGWGLTPTSLVRNGSACLTLAERIERHVLWRPLSVVCEVKRLSAGRGLAMEGDGTPPLPFWARDGSAMKSLAAARAQQESPVKS